MRGLAGFLLNTCSGAQDLDGVNGPDLAVANFAFFSEDVSVLLNNGDGTFADDVIYGAGNRPSSVAVGDLDGVNGPDLAVANSNSDDVSPAYWSLLARPANSRTKAWSPCEARSLRTLEP